MPDNKNTHSDRSPIDKNIMYILIGIFTLLILILLLPVTSNISYIMLVREGNEAAKSVTKDFSMDYLTILLAAFGVCFALAGVIPYIISHFITKKEIDESVSKLFEGQYKSDLKKTLGSLKKADADHSRMNAFFLYSLEKPIWSIGWMGRSMISYLRCEQDYSNSQGLYDNIIEGCIRLIICDIKLFSEKINKIKTLYPAVDFTEVLQIVYNDDNCEDKNRVLKRTVADLIDYRIQNNNANKRFIIHEKNEEYNIISSFLRLSIKYLNLSDKEIKKLQEKSWHAEEDLFCQEYEKYLDTMEIDELNLFASLESDISALVSSPGGTRYMHAVKTHTPGMDIFIDALNDRN